MKTTIFTCDICGAPIGMNDDVRASFVARCKALAGEDE